MASVANDSNGHRRVQFVHTDGRRPSIRLGKVSQRTAKSFARRVEQLLECLRLNVPMDAPMFPASAISANVTSRPPSEISCTAVATPDSTSLRTCAPASFSAFRSTGGGGPSSRPWQARSH